MKETDQSPRGPCDYVRFEIYPNGPIRLPLGGKFVIAIVAAIVTAFGVYWLGLI
jgi:hypothetical protein